MRSHPDEAVGGDKPDGARRPAAAWFGGELMFTSTSLPAIQRDINTRGSLTLPVWSGPSSLAFDPLTHTHILPQIPRRRRHATLNPDSAARTAPPAKSAHSMLSLPHQRVGCGLPSCRPGRSGGEVG